MLGCWTQRALLIGVFSIAGCGKKDGRIEIVDTRIATHSPPLPSRPASARERFNMQGPSFDQGDSDAANASLPFKWDTPPGWQEIAPVSMRMINFRIGESANVDCYVTVLPGQGGGMAENINRWRGQMSLPPLSEQEILQMPQKKLLGRNATYILCDGAFKGMGQESANEGYTLAGMLLHHVGLSIFVKLIGPSDLVKPELDHFDSFCSSLRLIGGHVNDSQDQEDVADSIEGPLAWNVPAGWEMGDERPMRLVTFTPTVAINSECYITVLSGSGGGLLGNINRWRKQMGKSDLDHSSLEALPSISVLGRPAKLIELRGAFTGMSGTTQSNHMMLGVISELPNRSLFIKMTGPESEMQSQRDRFISFCSSVRNQ